MTEKMKNITELYKQTVTNMTRTPDNWKHFLRCACRNYKCRFDEQALISAQRPDAVAVLEIERWNKLGRWVNRGAKGIAVFKGDEKPQLKYYFDISDTHEGKNPSFVPLWNMKPAYEADVTETLENAFGELAEKETFPRALMSAANNAVCDNLPDYLEQLADCLDNSFLEEMDALNIEVAVQNTLYASVGYMLLTRCGINADDYFHFDDFKNVIDFNTPQTVNVLGAATGDIAEMALREIASTVLNLQKSEKEQIRTFDRPQRADYNKSITRNERGVTNERTDLHATGELLNSRFGDSRNADETVRQVRTETAEIPQGTQERTVHEPADDGQTERTSDGNRTDGEIENRADEQANGTSAGRDGGTQSERPNDMGGQDEQYSAQHRGNDSEGTHLQLNEDIPEQTAQTAEETQSSAVLRLSGFSQEDVDIALQRGSGFRDGNYRIYFWFQELHDDKETLDFFKREYGWGGGSQEFANEKRGWQNHSKKGLELSKTDGKLTLTWKQVAERIKYLISADMYLSEEQKAYIPHYLEELENRKIQRQKLDYILSVADLPPAEKRDTLTLRLTDYINMLENYEKKHIGENGLHEIADTASISLIEGVLANPQKVQMLFNALNKIQGATCDCHSRNNARHFNEELVELFPRNYVYHLGDKVHIGADKYEIQSIGEETVTLYNPKTPLFDAEMPRDEFDRKVKENPFNEHLIKIADIEPQTAENSQESVNPREDKFYIDDETGKVMWIYNVSDGSGGYYICNEVYADYILDVEETTDSAEDFFYELEERARNNNLSSDVIDFTEIDDGFNEIDYDFTGCTDGTMEALIEFAREFEAPENLIGRRYEIDGRIFIVDSVNEKFNEVSLCDITFQNGTGFPVFRSEKINVIRMFTPIKEKSESEEKAKTPETQPDYEKQSEPATAENAPDELGVPSDNIDDYLPQTETVKEAEKPSAPPPNNPLPFNIHIFGIPPFPEKEVTPPKKEPVKEPNSQVSLFDDDILPAEKEYKTLQDVENELDRKVNACVDNVYRIFNETQEQRLTQLVFCDLSTPKGKKEVIETSENDDGVFETVETPFKNIYEDIRKKLVAKGVSDEEIAFIHEADNEVQKKALFAKVRAGQIRVLIGSTSKMGAGTNVQDKLIALHDLDCPWRPRDLEQRAGRIVRRGNKNPDVHIYRYVTEGTFDAYLYQIIENKQKFISQVFTSKSPARVMQEIDEVVLSYAEIKALATGNPLIIERSQLEADVNKLRVLKSNHLSQRYELEDKVLKYYPSEIARIEGIVEGYETDISRRNEHTPVQSDPKEPVFAPMTVNGVKFAEKKAAGAAILAACKAMTNPDLIPLGEYRGFKMELEFSKFDSQYVVTLKNAISHGVSLGDDVFGNITRIDNVLDGMEQRLIKSQESLDSVRSQLKDAKSNMTEPFMREQELAEKERRLSEITIALKMDKPDRVIVDVEPDGKEAETSERNVRNDEDRER